MEQITDLSTNIAEDLIYLIESSRVHLAWEKPGYFARLAVRGEVHFGVAPGKPAMRFTRITVNPDQMGGVPCIRGLRIPVATVLAMLADGMRDDEILRHYPDLELDDIREALRYASEAVRERELPLRRAE